MCLTAWCLSIQTSFSSPGSLHLCQEYSSFLNAIYVFYVAFSCFFSTSLLAGIWERKEVLGHCPLAGATSVKTCSRNPQTCRSFTQETHCSLIDKITALQPTNCMGLLGPALVDSLASRGSARTHKVTRVQHGRNADALNDARWQPIKSHKSLPTLIIYTACWPYASEGGSRHEHRVDKGMKSASFLGRS